MNASRPSTFHFYRLLAVLSFAVLVSAAACAPAAPASVTGGDSKQASGSNAQPKAASTAPDGLDAATQAEWDALVEAARQEGSVEVILSGQMPEKLRPLMSEFEKKYGVKVNSQIGGGGDHANRILAEQQADRYSVDVWIGGANTALTRLLPGNALDPVEPLFVLPEVADPSHWYKGQHSWSDTEGKYVYTWGASPDEEVIVYNTDLVDPSEIQSYWDLLDPKWKGKIVARDPSAAGTGGTSVPFYLNPELGPEWLRRLFHETDLTVVSDARQGAEWVATGKFSIGLFALATPVNDLKKEGLPVESGLPHALKEAPPLSASAANLFILKQAPHPNAQKLFVNWALSREGQLLFIKEIADAAPSDSLRMDIPKDVVPPEARIKPNVNYYVPFLDREYQTRQKEALEFMKQELIAAGKKS